MHVLAALLLVPGIVGQSEGMGPLAWPAGPLEVRVALPEAIDEGRAAAAVGRPIAFEGLRAGRDGEPGDAPLGTLRIAGARLRDGGRTLVLLTDPHPAEAIYRAGLPDGIGPIRYDLTGAEASWTPEGEAEPGWSGWLPELDLSAARARSAASVEHAEAFERMAAAGSLELRTLLALPEGEVVVAIESDRPFEAELSYEPLGLEADRRHRAEGVVETFGEPAELFLTIPTGPAWGVGLPELRVTVREAAEGPARPVGRSAQILPWAPAPIVDEGEIPELPDELTGGDPVRGEAVFFGEAGKCSDCHRVGDRGGVVGPDLSGVGARRTPAEIARAIEAPSAAIDPDYLPYSVAMRDGRVFVGLVRAEGPETIRVVGADARAVDLERAEIEEIRPVSTSIMPVGLAGALGRRDLRDLLAYLDTCRED